MNPVATPEPMLTVWLNLNPITAGYGTVLSAYWGKDGFDFFSFAVGMLIHWMMLLAYGLMYFFFSLWIGLLIWLLAYLPNLYLTHRIYSSSREVYYPK